MRMPSFDKTLNNAVIYLTLNYAICRVVPNDRLRPSCYLLYIDNFGKPVKLFKAKGRCSFMDNKGNLHIFPISYLLDWIKGKKIPVPNLPLFSQFLGEQNDF